MTVDLLVVNYNTQSLLERFLNTLHEESTKDIWRLHVADNGSTDGSREFLQANHLRWNITNLFLNKNIGYSAAMNQMAAMGTGEIIGILNADVWLSENDVRAIQKSFDEHPEQAIMGPKQRDENGHIRHAGIVGPLTKPQHRGWNVHDPYDVQYRDRVQCATVSGSAYFIRRSVWDELTNCEVYRDLFPNPVGAFLPSPHYFEETWCSYHAIKHGYQVWYDGRISIGHTWAASTNGPSPILNKYFQISRDIFRKAADYHGIEHD